MLELFSFPAGFYQTDEGIFRRVHAVVGIASSSTL
jgi:hypothetical protein